MKKVILTNFWREVDMTVTESKGFTTTQDVFTYKEPNTEYFQMTPGSSITSVTIKTHER